MTLETLVGLEPRLADLLAQARHTPAGARSWRTYESAKRQLGQLVGYHVDHPVLGTVEAYDRALHALVRELDL